MTLKRLQEETHSPTRLGRRLAGQGSQQSILRPGADPLQTGRGLFPYVKIVAVKVGDEPMNLISLRRGGRFQARPLQEIDRPRRRGQGPEGFVSLRSVVASQF